jgi:hypothetical protein
MVLFLIYILNRVILATLVVYHAMDYHLLNAQFVQPDIIWIYMFVSAHILPTSILILQLLVVRLATCYVGAVMVPLNLIV